jgi:hypothetical protein
LSVLRCLAKLAVVGLVVPASSAAGVSSFTVTSSLDGRTVLPHRIPWTARTMLAPSRVKEVDFLVDGKQVWAEHRAPYVFGDDGNMLVTSFLTPGRHRFTVRLVSTSGASAVDGATAKVLPAPSPPAQLAGTWTSYRPKGGVPAGDWRLVIDKVGWRILDTKGGGNLVDVVYSGASLATIESGMVSGRPGLDGNGWCNDRPGTPVRTRWSIQAGHLAFSAAGGHGCAADLVKFLAQGVWDKRT